VISQHDNDDGIFVYLTTDITNVIRGKSHTREEYGQVLKSMWTKRFDDSEKPSFFGFELSDKTLIKESLKYITYRTTKEIWKPVLESPRNSFMFFLYKQLEMAKGILSQEDFDLLNETLQEYHDEYLGWRTSIVKQNLVFLVEHAQEHYQESARDATFIGSSQVSELYEAVGAWYELNGKERVFLKNNCPGLFFMHVKSFGETENKRIIRGTIDDKFGSGSFEGEIRQNNIRFVKRYLPEAVQRGAPESDINYEGNLLLKDTSHKQHFFLTGYTGTCSIDYLNNQSQKGTSPFILTQINGFKRL